MDYSDGKQVARLMPKVRLANGLLMPQLGFGTSSLDEHQVDAADAYAALRHALHCGYRLVDTAALYQNEQLVGRALADALAEEEAKVEEESLRLRRDDLFVCTKLWNSAHKFHSVEVALRESLARLQMDYVDLYLIHWPMAYEERSWGAADWINPRSPAGGQKVLYSDTHFLETWRAMEHCLEAGLARSIGLSNFNEQQCAQVLRASKHKPVVNQVEAHPYLGQESLLQFCKLNSIALQAYCPLGAPGASWAPPGAPRLLDDPLIARKLAPKHARSPAQIVLRHHLQRGLVPLPKSITKARIEQNLRVLDFELEPSEMEALGGLERQLRYCTNTAGEYVTDHPLYPF